MELKCEVSATEARERNNEVCSRQQFQLMSTKEGRMKTMRFEERGKGKQILCV